MVYMLKSDLYFSCFLSKHQTCLHPSFIGRVPLGLQPAIDSGSNLIRLCLYVSISLSLWAGWHLWPCQGCQIACQRPSIKYNDKPSNALPHEFQPEMRGCGLSSLKADRCATEQHTHQTHTQRSPPYQNNDQQNGRLITLLTVHVKYVN